MTEKTLSLMLQSCKSLNDVVDAFCRIGFQKVQSYDIRRQALAITSSREERLNIAVVETLPSTIQANEKHANVRFALYIESSFQSFKFFDTYASSGLGQSYIFSVAALNDKSFGNITRAKLDGVRFNDIDSLENLVKTTTEEAIQNFEYNLKIIIDSIRTEIINKIKKNANLKKSIEETVQVFASFIGPEFQKNALIELLIQHLLTKDIFSAAYGQKFHDSNNVANCLNILSQCFDDVPTLVNNKHELNERRDGIIKVIKLNPPEERAEIIKLVYEAFYAVYNPKDADRLGIVYTPQVAVDFIIKSVDGLMSKHLKTHLFHKNTHIIDPCVGTGTFILTLLEFLYTKLRNNSKTFVYKYENEIHANEVSILAYYIAAVNIERLFSSLAKHTAPFRGIIWRDTLLALNLNDFHEIGSVNVTRMGIQQQCKITAILGNPPYNVGQKNFGDGNPNPLYFSAGSGVDDRISETYLKNSNFRKQTRDMYKRFIRWATDRIGDKGIVSFISNNSFIHANNYDGVRACLAKEFDYIYICDLRGNAHKSGEAWQKEGDKFFGTKSRVGTAIYFLIKCKKKNKTEAKIYYADVGEAKKQFEKFAWLNHKTVADMEFKIVTPTQDHMWVADKSKSEYKQFLPLISFKTKNNVKNADAIFELFTNGIKTNADAWQIDFDKKNLIKKLTVYVEEYNRIRSTYHSQKNPKNVDIMKYIEQSTIPWYGELDQKARMNKPMSIKRSQIQSILYRPFVSKYFHYDRICVQRLYRWPDIIPQNKNFEVPSICVRSRSATKFECVGGFGFIDHGALVSSQVVPLYRVGPYGEIVSNVSDFGLSTFRKHYKNSNISPSDIFYYCYAVMHDPQYLEKYSSETRTLHPHIPLHPEFNNWKTKGKTLFDIHVNYKKQPPYPLIPIDEGGDKTKAVLNLTKSTNKNWKARIDESYSMDGIPEVAANPKLGGYVIGARTPIGWMLEYYQKACKANQLEDVSAEKVCLDFSLYRNEIINLVGVLCTVSIKTIKIKKQLAKLSHSFEPCQKVCCKALKHEEQTSTDLTQTQTNEKNFVAKHHKNKERYDAHN